MELHIPRFTELKPQINLFSFNVIIFVGLIGFPDLLLLFCGFERLVQYVTLHANEKEKNYKSITYSITYEFEYIQIWWDILKKAIGI